MTTDCKRRWRIGDKDVGCVVDIVANKSKMPNQDLLVCGCLASGQSG